MDQKLSGTRSRTCVRAPKAIILNGNFRRRKAGTVFGRDCKVVAAKQGGPEISLSCFLWLYRVKNGLTALPEPWDAHTDHSHNHLMLGHLQEWFYAQVGGGGQRDPTAAAYKRFVVKPADFTPVGSISGRGDLHFRKAAGRISARETP